MRVTIIAWLISCAGLAWGTQEMKGRVSVEYFSDSQCFTNPIAYFNGKLAKTYIDDGKLVPDNVIMGLIDDRLTQDDCKTGYIFDGFPRTIPQAEGLDKLDNIDKVILLTTDDEVIVERMKGRRMCKCGATYHIINNPPKDDNLCDKCSSQLYIREDDKEETVRKRLDGCSASSCTGSSSS